jgi:predicted small metal-binding protein
MAKMIKCDCGYVARGDTDDALIESATRHAREVHDMELSPEQALSLAVPADA